MKEIVRQMIIDPRDLKKIQQIIYEVKVPGGEPFGLFKFQKIKKNGKTRTP